VAILREFGVQPFAKAFDLADADAVFAVDKEMGGARLIERIEGLDQPPGVELGAP
jgi:hypothetical protein